MTDKICTKCGQEIPMDSISALRRYLDNHARRDERHDKGFRDVWSEKKAPASVQAMLDKPYEISKWHRWRDALDELIAAGPRT